MSKRASRLIRLVALGSVILVAASGVRVALQNVHVVAQGELIRSAQLSGAPLRDTLARFGVRSVLNLRGPRPGQDWYEEETRTVASQGLVHEDFELSATRELPVARAAELVDVMRRLPKPLLVHCQAGADRSGLASALYRYAVLGQSPADAAGELSLWFGHIPVRETAAMDRSFAAFVQANP